MKDKIISCALFGDELKGNNLVRYIYIDEAGISAQEPVTVVVGIIIHADTQWKLAESKIIELFNNEIPECHKQNFIFHAKSIWGSKKYRENWSRQDRFRFLCSMMKIPRQLNIPIALGISNRYFSKIITPSKISHEEIDHLMAFIICVSQVERYIKKYADVNEIATIVAEDIPKIRRLLRSLFHSIKDIPIIFAANQLYQAGNLFGGPKHAKEISISRIIDTVHFTEKAYAPLLQLADACAYGFRRYFSKQKYGEDFIRSILGKTLNIDDYYSAPCAGNYFGRFSQKINNY